MLDLPTVEAMHTVSAAMVDAAQANDWDRLAALERQLAEMRRKAQFDPRGTTEDAAASPDIERMRTLIQAMLEHDVEIRRHVEPWLASTRRFLASRTQDRKVRNAYGAIGP